MSCVVAFVLIPGMSKGEVFGGRKVTLKVSPLRRVIMTSSVRAVSKTSAKRDRASE